MASSSIYSTLHEKLEEFKSLEIVERHLKTTGSSLKAAYSALKKLEKQLDKENRDIEKLEKLSVKKLFHKVLGNQEEQLEKERQDFLEVSLKYNEHKKTIELLEFEMDVLEGKSENLPILKREIERLKKLREKELLKSKGKLGKELRAIIQQSDDLVMGLREYDEAIIVGKDILEHFAAVLKYLKQAKDWGAWKMAGGRNMSSHNQRNAIDRARQLIYKTQHLLNILKKELQDINVYDFDTSLNSEQLDSFTNIFFDNLITDWIIQKKIKNTSAEIRSLYDRIKRLMSYLKTEKKKMKNALALLESRRQEIIITNK